MPIDVSNIQDNVAEVRARVERALDRAGRRGEPVTIVGVTKTFGAEMVNAVVEAGIEDIGENRIQEFVAKAGDVIRPCRWHLIGHLQRNKATRAIGRFHLIHSIDSVRIAETLDRLGAERGVTTQALLQVNTSGEDSKHGVTPGEAAATLQTLAGLEHVDIRGLMTIGPLSPDPDHTKRAFAELRALRETLRGTSGLALAELSMGMSGDFEVAIEQGATIIRVGTTITGARTR